MDVAERPEFDRNVAAVRAQLDSCIAAESSGLTQELRFKRDLAASLADDPTADPAFKAWLDEQIKYEASDLRSRELWDLYCGAFEN